MSNKNELTNRKDLQRNLWYTCDWYRVYVKSTQNLFFKISSAILFLNTLRLTLKATDLIDVLNNWSNIFFRLRIFLVFPIWNWKKDMVGTGDSTMIQEDLTWASEWHNLQKHPYSKNKIKIFLKETINKCRYAQKLS